MASGKRVVLKFDEKAFINDLMNKAVEKSQIKVGKGYIGKLRDSVEREGNKAIEGMFPFMVKSLMGIESRPNQGVRITASDMLEKDSGAVTGKDLRAQVFDRRQKFNRFSYLAIWEPLSLGYTKMKGHRRFWEKSGALKRYFQRSSATFLFGDMRVKVNPKNAAKLELAGRGSTSVLIGTLQISYFHKIQRFLDAISKEDFDPDVKLERSRFFPEIARKLAGPSLRKGYTNSEGKRVNPFKYNRPLVQPVLYYYLNYKIPQIVAANIKKRVNNQRAAQK